MKRPPCILAITGIFFLLATVSARADVTPIAGWDNQLFPSYLIATAALKLEPQEESGNTLGDTNGQLGVILVATEDDQAVTVSIRCDEFLETSEFSGSLPTAGETYVIYPKIRYRFDRLGKCRQATPATVTYLVNMGSEASEELSMTVTFRSINDCPLQVRTESDVVDTKFAFAAYVNEQHPFVDKLLREALDLGVVDKFDGYQSGNPQDVVRQVYALWDLLAARDVRYSSITTTVADSDAVPSQHIRMLEETANNSQANCVDGSVLLVSLLRKIGIHAALVLEPGHCFVAFSADADGKIALGLETTLITAELESPEEIDELLDESVDENMRNETSWSSFVAAVNVGTSTLVKNDEQLKSGRDDDYAFIDIRTWRAKGVLPIPFHGEEKLVSYELSSDDGATDADEDDEEAE